MSMAECTRQDEAPPLRPDGFRRAKWATLGVMFSTIVFFLLPVTLGWPGAPLHLMGSGFGFATQWLDGCTLGLGLGLEMLVSHARTRGLRIQFVILSVGCLLMPLFMHLSPARCFPSVEPIGARVLIGSGLFGLGSQLAQLDTLGALLATGRGSLDGLVPLVGLLLGSLMGVLVDVEQTRLLGWHLPSVTLVGWLGLPLGVLAQLGLLGAGYVGLLSIERYNHGEVQPLVTSPVEQQAVGAEDLAESGQNSDSEEPDDDEADEAVGLLAAAEVLTLPKPGGGLTMLQLSMLTLAFTMTNVLSLLVGSHLINPGIGVAGWVVQVSHLFGWDIDLPEHQKPRAQLREEEVTPELVQAASQNLSVLLVATCLAIFTQQIQWCTESAWALCSFGRMSGGVLMGFGATIAAGDVVGGFWAGVLSTSLHAWVWLGGALVGTMVGSWTLKVCVCAPVRDWCYHADAKIGDSDSF